MRALGASRTSLVPGGVLAGPWVRDDLWRRARAVPSLDLRFADNKSLTDSVTGASLVTFTRSGNGTYTDSAGVLQTAATDVPRFDHNPTTGESLGLLVEEQRTNSFTYSEELDNAAWGTFNTTVTQNASTAPNGTLTAEKLVENTSNSTHDLRRFGVSFTSGLNYVFSIYAKQDGRSLLLLSLPSAAFGVVAQARFDLAAGTSTIVTAGTGTSASIANVGGGWFRCVFVAQATATASGTCFWNLQVSTVSSTYTGDGTSGIYLWGAQLEAGAFPTSYIPTTTAAVTRNADLASITGSAFSGWYRQDEGSFFCSTFAPKGIVVYGTGDTFDNTQYASVGSSNNVSVRSGGAISALMTAPVSTTALTNVAHGYAADNFAAVSNGGTIATDTTAAVPLAQVRLKLGSSAWDTGGGNNINGHIRRLTFWGQRLPNNILQQITQ